MIDFNKLNKKYMDKIMKHFKVDTDPIFSSRFVKFIKWFGYKLMPVVLTITGILMLFWIFTKIYDRSGFEKTIIYLLILILISLRGT